MATTPPGGIEGLRHLLKGDVSDPVVNGFARAFVGTGRERGWREQTAADRDPADGVVANVALVVGVLHVLRGAAKDGESGAEAGSSPSRRVDGEEG